MAGEGKVVCVTGASGYIASWLVKELLLRGYTVKATVRNLNDPSKTEHLVSLEGAKERLHLCKADLLEDNIFDSIIDGCDGVFHTACPVVFAVSDPQSELIDPAVKGTLNVLHSCARASSVKRVVVTSSWASVAFNRTPLAPDVVIDETWFTDPTLAEEIKYWYMLAKTLAEKAARQFAEENGIDLITIHPGWVFGPLLQPTLNTSVRELLNIINGKESVPDGIYVCTDIRDVVEAHIQALEIPSANGRYLMVGHVVHFTGILKILKKLFPSLRVAERFSEDLLYDKSLEQTYRVSMERAKSLGIDFIPLELCLKDTIESLVVKNLISL